MGTAIRDIVYQCTKLNGTGKQGILTPDEFGYYTICVGALKTFNSRGEYYTEDGVLQFFEKNSEFMRWVEKGCLKAEYGHPKPLPGMSQEEWLTRVVEMDEKNVCAHFRQIWLEYSDGKDHNGRPVILIMVKVKPSGPYGKFLEESLKNPHENVCFSIRAFTERFQQGFNIIKRITRIMAFDLVTEPGLSEATKYGSPSLEKFSLVDYTPEQIGRDHELILERGLIERAQAYMENSPGVAMEHTKANLMGLYDIVCREDRLKNPPEHRQPLRHW